MKIRRAAPGLKAMQGTISVITIVKLLDDSGVAFHMEKKP